MFEAVVAKRYSIWLLPRWLWVWFLLALVTKQYWNSTRYDLKIVQCNRATLGFFCLSCYVRDTEWKYKKKKFFFILYLRYKFPLYLKFKLPNEIDIWTVLSLNDFDVKILKYFSSIIEVRSLATSVVFYIPSIFWAIQVIY